MSKRDQFETFAEKKITELSVRLTKAVEVELTKLAKRFPRRRFFYREAMGSSDIYIQVFNENWWTNGVRFDLMGTGATVVGSSNMDEVSAMGAYGNLFEDFKALLAWIDDMSTTYRITCDDIDIPTDFRRTS